MRDLTQCHYIISPDTLNDTTRRDEMVKRLKDAGLDRTQGLGVYKGSTETSFLIEATHANEAFFLRLAKEFNQECFLKVYWDNAAEMIYSDGSRKMIGNMVLTDRENALKSDYSLFNGLYFQVKG